jgi:F0F1-type ATP synthase membrane subunit b/b'
MKRRGEEELADEKVRLAEATAHERQRLIDQTHREIELQSRLARRDLVSHSVELSISLARTRIQKDITADDQARLIDRYASGVRA